MKKNTCPTCGLPLHITTGIVCGWCINTQCAEYGQIKNFCPKHGPHPHLEVCRECRDPDHYAAMRLSSAADFQRHYFGSLPATWIAYRIKKYWRRYRSLDAYINTVNDAKICLDIGGGLGGLWRCMLNTSHTFVVDPIFRILNWYAPINTHLVGDHFTSTLSISNLSADLVVCSNVLDHVADPEDLLRGAYAALQPGGHMILTCEIFPETRPQRDNTHLWGFGREDILGLLTAAGFEQNATTIYETLCRPQLSRFVRLQRIRLVGRELVVVCRKEGER